jgi:tetratricopeptide (TPR) repeat protein
MQIVHKKNAPLEQKRRLSQSILWKLQRNYFDRQGVEAWRTGTLPHHITSSPFIADAYARVLLGYLRDCASSVAVDANDSSTVLLDRSQPVYIVELGSGHGRFGYLFLKKFLGVYLDSVLRDVPVKYVMTDFAESNLEHLREHSWLQPFVEQGFLDFARFDVEHDGELELVCSGEKLSPDTLRNPLVVIANYVFDSIPQDAFHVVGGQLYEMLVTVSSQQKEPDLDDPLMLARAEISYHNNIIEGDYYDDPEWNRILQDYRQRLPVASFLFPTAAMRCISNLDRLSNGRMLLLSADRGYHEDEAILEGQGLPTITMHGSFSMTVDYRIIGEYFKRRDGHMLHPAHPHESLNVSAFMLGDLSGGYTETRQAYAEAIEKFGPDDYFTLKSGIEQVYEALSLKQLLAFLRLSGWDYKRFLECLPALKNCLQGAPDIQKQELRRIVRQVWDVYLPIGEADDLAFELGTLLLEMEFYTEATEFLQHSVSLYGMEPGTAYNLAVCHYSLRQMETALEYVNQALEPDSEFDAAKALRIKIQSELIG